MKKMILAVVKLIKIQEMLFLIKRLKMNYPIYLMSS